MNKKVSIIVPVYNVEEYLPECIDSLIGQTYKNLEIILVDDGAKDKSGNICDEYAKKDERIRVIHKKNGGLGDARNTGAKSATGEYLLFIDSDDWVHEDLVKKTFEAAEAKNADIVLFHFARVEEGKITGSSSVNVNVPVNEALSVENNPQIIVSSWSGVDKLYRRSFWEENAFQFTVGRYFEDLGTIPKVMAMAKKVVHIPDVLYYYRIRKSSIMHDPNLEKKYIDRIFVMEDVLAYYKEHGIYEKFEKELEYLVLKNLYFYPAREIVYHDKDSEYLPRFKKYAFEKFPKLAKNTYLKELPFNEKVFWFLIKRNWYGMVLLLSKIRIGVSKILN